MTLNTTLPFMAQRKVEKRKFIEGILNLQIFSDMLLSARSEYNDVQKKYEHITKDYDHTNSIYTLLKEQKDNIINNVKDQQSKILLRVEEIKEGIESNKSKLKNINKELYIKSKEKYASIEEKLTDISTQISNVKTKITRHETEINFHTKKLNEIGTKDSVCPVCLQEITKNDREHIELEKNKIRKEITNCEEDI